MAERDRPVYCTQCGSIVQPGDNFCAVCGARVSPAAQDAAPTQEIPTQVYPPPGASRRERSPVLTVVLGLGAVLAVVVAVGAIFALNLLGSETAEQGGAEPSPAATTPPSDKTAQSTSKRDEEPETLGVGDSVEVKGIRATLNKVRTLPTTDLDQPVESPDNLFVATDLLREHLRGNRGSL